MAGTYLPLAAVLLATAVTLLVATSAVPVAAADKYSGRMVIIRARPSATVVSAGSALNKQRRLVEDEVAPEFGGGGHLLGAENLNYEGLDPNKQVCLKEHNCGARGEPYTGRSCQSTYPCPKKPGVWHARAVHV